MTQRVKEASSNTESTDPTKAAPDNTKPLGDRPSDAAIKNATRRLSFNGSSYSGTDIKILVHKYHAGPVDILAKLEQAISIYKDVSFKIDSLIINTQTIADIDPNTPQDEYIVLFRGLWTSIVSAISSQESSISTGSLNQNIAKNIAPLTVGVKINPEYTRSRLNEVKKDLESLISAWESQKKAINRKKEDGKFFQTKVLAELQTLSIQAYREKKPVKALGKSNPTGWVRGQRTIAGSMIFTVFDRNVLFELLDFDPSDFADNPLRPAILDQLPPIDITIQFANEYGSLSRMTIYGVEFISEAKTMSIENIYLESEVQYVARDYDPMTPVLAEDGTPYSELMNSYNQAVSYVNRPDKPLTASDLIGSEWGSKDTNEDAALTRFKNRYNPFL